MSNANDRQQQLLSLINSKGMLSVKAFSNLLGVSEMTIRRDLKHLRGDGTSVPGDAPSSASHSEYNRLDELQKSNEQKTRIGKFAAGLISPADVIIIDTGSTTARILPYIPADYPLTVLCFNANILDGIRHYNNINLLFCGGHYHRKTEMFESPEGLQFIKGIRANKVFLSAAGVHRSLGITCANSYEVATKQAIIQSSQERILLADSGKFDAVRSAYFGDLSEISTIVTDSNLSAEWAEYLRSQGIALHLV